MRFKRLLYGIPATIRRDTPLSKIAEDPHRSEPFVVAAPSGIVFGKAGVI